MATNKFNYQRIKRGDAKDGTKGTYNSVSMNEYELFNSSLLGLGNISKEGEYVQALAAFLDLQGFTSFCNQVDAHLVIPEFLHSYINWLFEELRTEFKHSEENHRVIIWGSLPLFTKFLGDGILLLWDTTHSPGPIAIKNIALTLHIICRNYRTKFLPEISRQVSKPPSALRCGIARGQIISIGDGKDYVGSCINVASRLQKLSQLTFAISKRGFTFTTVEGKGDWLDLILKKVKLAGIGDDELVYIKKSEFELLPPHEQKLFKDP